MSDGGREQPEQRPIALLVASLGAGGAERVALNLAQAFRSGGNRVDLLVVNRSGRLQTEVPGGIRVVDLHSKRASRAVGALRRYLRTEAPAAVISFAFQANLLSVVATLGLPSKPRLVLTIHSTISEAFDRLPMFRRWTLSAATRSLYPRADAIIAVSRGAAADLVRFGVRARRLATIHNPVIRGDFEETVRAKADHPWLAGGGVPVIVTVGRLTRAKDHRLLLAAFQQVRRKRQARLMVVGDGELKDHLEAEAERLGVAQDVAFLGHIANPFPYMREAELFVLSSAWEGFGNALVEAMGTGTPVVATDCPHGPREILEDGKWGRLVPVGDADALTSAMLDVLRNGGPNARDRAADFTVEAAAGRYLALLRDVGTFAEAPGVRPRA